MASFVVQGRQVFPEGTKVGVYPRLTDSFTPALEMVSSATVKDGEAKFTGLQDDTPYYAAASVDGSWRSVAFTPTNEGFASSDPLKRQVGASATDQVLRERQARAKLHRAAVGEVLPGSAAPGYDTGYAPVVGARGSGRPKVSEREPQPFANQQDVSGIPQRSDTPYGSVHPKDPKEIVPVPSQDDVKKSQVQRSDTELGEATPKDKREVEPALKQEDARGPQRSSTELGSAEPKPVPTKVRESSKSKAAGRSAAKPKSKTTKGS